MYKYFVSYNMTTTSGFCFGHVEATIDTKITGIDDIKDLAKLIEQDNNFPHQSVIIINYKLFGKEE